MSYSIKLLEQERVLLVTWHADFDFLKESEVLTAEMMALLKTARKPVYFINDVREAPFTYEELLAATNAAARGENPLFKHPKILGVFSVTTSEIVQMAAKGMDSDVFNHTAVNVVAGVEEALEMIRRKTK